MSHYVCIKKIIIICFFFYMFSIKADDAIGGNKSYFPLIRYQPIYAIIGEPDAKVQFSFKIKVLRNYNFYFAYTQTMFWDVLKNSSPFREIIYNPDFLYRLDLKENFLNSIDFSFLEHKSNGKGGVDSRAINRSYLRFNTIARWGSRDVNWDTKFFYILNVSDNNRDIRDYSSFWDTRISLKYNVKDHFFSDEFYLHFGPGGKYSGKPFQGFQEVGYRFKLFASKVAPFIYVQVYNGYIEDLVQYNVKHTSYRIGFSI